MDAAQIAHLVEKAVLCASPLLPSILVAATPYPKASKALRVLSHVLQFFSVLSHKDCPGTLKAPGAIQRSDEGGDDEPTIRERPDDPPAAREPAEGSSPGESEAEFLRELVWRLLDGYTPPRVRR